MNLSQRPRVLVSDRVYAAWARTTRLVCATVLPIVFIVLVVVYSAHHDGVWVDIFRPIGVTLTVAMYLLVGVTTAYALVDRRDDGDGR